MRDVPPADLFVVEPTLDATLPGFQMGCVKFRQLRKSHLVTYRTPSRGNSHVGDVLAVPPGRSHLSPEYLATSFRKYSFKSPSK